MTTAAPARLDCPPWCRDAGGGHWAEIPGARADAGLVLHTAPLAAVPDADGDQLAYEVTLVQSESIEEETTGDRGPLRIRVATREPANLGPLQARMLAAILLDAADQAERLTP